jgi:hypothetical protein
MGHLHSASDDTVQNFKGIEAKGAKSSNGQLCPDANRAHKGPFPFLRKLLSLGVLFNLLDGKKFFEVPRQLHRHRADDLDFLRRHARLFRSDLNNPDSGPGHHQGHD